MAGVFPFSALPRRMTKLGEGVRKGVTKLIQDVATGIGSTVVDNTPVDTGVARSNWRATLSGPASGTIPAYSPGNKLGIGEGANASAAKAQQGSAIKRFNSAKHAHIYITNNVTYIGLLAAGSSAQSPASMVKLGLQTGRAIIQANSGKLLRNR